MFALPILCAAEIYFTNGISNCLQIIRQVMSFKSAWRGTVVALLLPKFLKMECFEPSRAKTQLCSFRCFRKKFRFIQGKEFLFYVEGKGFCEKICVPQLYSSPTSFAGHLINFRVTPVRCCLAK